PGAHGASIDTTRSRWDRLLRAAPTHVGPLTPPTPPTPPSEAAPGRTGSAGATGSLKRGHRGAAVRALQERLELLGVMTEPVDEQFGLATEAAVTTIQ